MSDRLRHVLRALNQPWAITPDGFETVCSILDRRAAGIRLSDDHIREIIAESRAEFEAAHAASPMTKPAANGGTLAIISLYGTILPRPVPNVSGGGGASLTQFMDTFRAADADPNVKAILLDVDSPGGSVDLVPEAAALIRNAETPVTGIANTMAGSASYYLLSQADEVVASPSGQVGSIGVFARHIDYSGQLEQDGMAVTLISAGDNKTLGNPYEPLSDQAHASIQSTVDDFYNMFVEDVARGRGVDTDTVLGSFGQGLMFTAQSALGVGMVDRVDTFDATVQRLLGSQQSGFRSSSPLALQAADDEDVIVAEPLIPVDETAAEASPAQPEERQGGADKPAPLHPRIARAVAGR